MSADAPLWASLAILALCLGAAVSDVRAYRIPNVFSIALAALFPVYALIHPAAGAEILSHLASAALAFALGFLLYWNRMMGGGDVKLFTALALWAPLDVFIQLTIAITLSGAVLALIYLIRRWRRGADGRAGLSLTRLPYGVAIASGALITVVTTQIA